MYQAVFRRYELKYILTRDQKSKIISLMEPYMSRDTYGRTTIRNLYFDTDTNLIIRKSIEKPIYKEKLRIRSYAKAEEDDTVFAELKKKYRGIVCKRRLSLAESDAVKWLSGKAPCPLNTQISREIDYFISYYGLLSPRIFISYDREAYYLDTDSSFRITFDDNILARDNCLSLGEKIFGEPLLDDGQILMEIKCSGSVPLWMTKIFSDERIYKTSFSKYGTAYRTIIYPQIHKLKEETYYVC